MHIVKCIHIIKEWHDRKWKLEFKCFFPAPRGVRRTSRITAPKQQGGRQDGQHRSPEGLIMDVHARPPPPVRLSAEGLGISREKDPQVILKFRKFEQISKALGLKHACKSQTVYLLEASICSFVNEDNSLHSQGREMCVKVPNSACTVPQTFTLAAYGRAHILHHNQYTHPQTCVCACVCVSATDPTKQCSYPHFRQCCLRVSDQVDSDFI